MTLFRTRSDTTGNYDDCFRSASLSTVGQPKGVAIGDGDVVFIATVSKIEAISGGNKAASLSPTYTPTCIAANGKVVAVGAEVCPINQLSKVYSLFLGS